MISSKIKHQIANDFIIYHFTIITYHFIIVIAAREH